MALDVLNITDPTDKKRTPLGMPSPVGPIAMLGREVSRRSLGAILLGLAVGLLAACGPAMYTLNLIPASQALEQAAEINADEHAPYEYYLAVENLKKAREEASEASYEDAIRFAEVAERFGNKALDLSRRRMRELGR